MVTLFDILRSAQQGAAIENLSRQFGLGPDQMQRAVEALLPAFALAFRRSSQSPNAFAPLLEMLGSGRFAPFFDGGGGTGLAQSNAQQVLANLFGSSEVSRQIAAQASQATGIAADILQQMLPIVAATLMGGLFRMMSVEGMADVLQSWAEWLRRLAPQPPRMSQAASSPQQAWADAMSATFGLASKKPDPPADPWSSFMKAFTGEASRPKTPPPSPVPFGSLSQMLDIGLNVQSQYLASLQAILDAGTGAPSKTARHAAS